MKALRVVPSSSSCLSAASPLRTLRQQRKNLDEDGAQRLLLTRLSDGDEKLRELRCDRVQHRRRKLLHLLHNRSSPLWALALFTAARRTSIPDGGVSRPSRDPSFEKSLRRKYDRLRLDNQHTTRTKHTAHTIHQRQRRQQPEHLDRRQGAHGGRLARRRADPLAHGRHERARAPYAAARHERAVRQRQRRDDRPGVTRVWAAATAVAATTATTATAVTAVVRARAARDTAAAMAMAAAARTRLRGRRP